VTVLFADVVHSMDIASAVGAERLREIMADFADCCAAVVKRYGGTVDKFTGDGIMVVFGAPVALEDHAIRACLAALGVQEEAKRQAVDAPPRRCRSPYRLHDETIDSEFEEHRASGRAESRHVENAWLRGTYRVGRGDAMTAVTPAACPSSLEIDEIRGSQNSVPELPWTPTDGQRHRGQAGIF
jgi:Adenylate and Guanylate cyclase catalytic domain